MTQLVVQDRAIRRVLWALLFVSSVVATVVAIRISTMSLVLGSEEGRRVYPYLAHFPPGGVRVLARVLLVAGVMASIPLGLVRRWQWIVVGAWLVVGFGLQAELRSQTRYSLQQMFESDGANGYYAAVKTYPAGEVLRRFEEIRPTLSVHARGNMPGKLLFLAALSWLTTDPAVLPWLVVACSNLGGLLLYLFVRDLTGDRVSGLIALIFYLFVPAKLFFFPVLNTVTPVVVLAFAWLWLLAVRHQRPVHAALLGLAFYALVFYEPLPLVMGVMFAILTWQMLRTGELAWRVWGRQAAIAVAAVLAVHILMLATFNFDVLRAFQLLWVEAVEFNQIAQRPYTVWVFQNLFDFTVGMGVGPAVLTLGLLGVALWQRWWQPVVMASVGGLMTVLAVDLLGVNRGEVVRLWIFLACVLQIPAAIVCARLESRAAVFLVLSTTIVQGALGTAMMGFATP